MNANFKYLIYCFIAFLTFSCKEDAVDPVEDLAYFKEDLSSFGPIIDRNATYSPDGTKIAFCRMPLGLEYLNEEGLYLMDSDGSNLKFLYKGLASSPKFSPDGKKLAFSGFEGLSIIDFKNNTIQNLDKALVTGILDWSPDGKQIVTSGTDDADNKSGSIIGVIDTNLNFSTYQQITKPRTGDASYPVFSKDQNYIYFFKYSTYDNSLFKSIQKVNLSTLETSLVSDDKFNSYNLNLNRVEEKLVHNTLDFNIVIRDVNGKFIQRLPVRGYTPSFHPNGKSLLISSPDSEGVGSRLATFNLETNKLRFIRYY